jgi:signal transduction histidine kinase
VYRERDGVALLLILAATLPYYVRRRAPLAVYIVTMTAVVVLMLRGYGEGALALMLLLGAYTVGAWCPPRQVVAAAAVTAVLLVILLIGDAPDFGPGELVASSAAFGLALLIGWTMQTRRQRIDAFDRDQQEVARRVAADERLRIAQELHDIVAHSLGLIAVQAGVGMKVVDSDRAEAQRAFENISSTSRSSLAEIRRLLGVLRSTDGMPAYEPAPGLADLPRLAQDVTGAGLPVDLDVDGDIAAVPPGVGLAAYRIVQEALTNSLRHAEAHRATVRLDSSSGALLIEVADDGRGPNGRGSGGHGLIGMRERVAVYGGSLDVGPGPSGGFRVAANLRYETDPAA